MRLLLRYPLRFWLALVVVTPTVVVAVSGALVVAPRAQRASEGVALRTHRETGRRIRAELSPFLDTPHAANAANALLATAAPLTDEQWRRHLWRQIGEMPQVGYLQVGWAADGGFVGVERGDGGYVTEISDAGRTGKGVWGLDAAGEPTEPRRAWLPGYDARKRPWFAAAVTAGKPAWSPIYQFSSRDRVRMGITAVQPLVADGQIVAVFGADLVLSQLSDLLADHDLGPGSRIVLVERDGTLVATSSGSDPFRVGDGGVAARVPATSCGDAIVESAVRVALGADGAFDAGEGTERGEGMYVFAAPFADPRGLDWVVVVAVPEGEVLGTLPTDVAWAAALALAALGVGVFGSLLLSNALTGPLLRLADAARDLAEGRFDVALPPPTTRETEPLLAAFETMRRELRRNLQRAEAARHDAVVANRQKTSFLHGTSHEIRTPLTAILGYTELLLEEAPAQSRPDLVRIRTAATHLLRLINDILDLARVESGRLSLDLGPTDLGLVAREVGMELLPIVEAKGNRLVVDVLPGMTSVTTDAARIRQITVNLLANANKFTDSGTVRVSVVPEPQGVRVEVSDTGIGFDPGQIEALFLPFERASTVTDREGSGLGLAIVKRLTDLLGGKLTIDSTPGRGSTFRVHLPLHPTLVGATR